MSSARKSPHILRILRKTLWFQQEDLAPLLGIPKTKLRDSISNEAVTAPEVHVSVNMRLLYFFGAKPTYPWSGSPLRTIHGWAYDPAWYFAWCSVDSVPEHMMSPKTLEWELGYRMFLASARHRWFQYEYFPNELDEPSPNWIKIFKGFKIFKGRNLMEQRNPIVRSMQEAVSAIPSSNDIFEAVRRYDIFETVNAIGWLSLRDTAAVALRHRCARKLNVFGLKKHT